MSCPPMEGSLGLVGAPEYPLEGDMLEIVGGLTCEYNILHENNIKAAKPSDNRVFRFISHPHHLDYYFSA